MQYRKILVQFVAATSLIPSLVVAAVGGTLASELREEAGPTAVRLYAGLSVPEWHERIKNIDPRGTPAATVIEGLLQIVADEQLPGPDREPFAVFLARIGAPASRVVPLLVPLLQHRSAEETDYLWAARALALMGAPAKDATPALIDLVFDTGIPVSHRQSPVAALARIGAAHPDAIPALLRLLEYRASAGTSAVDAALMRQLAADSIYVVGPDADVAAPLLIRMVRNPRETEAVRRSAIIALGAFKERGAMAIDALSEELIRGQSPALRDVAAQALVAMGEAALPHVSYFLSHPDPEVRWRLAHYLGKLAIRPIPEVVRTRLRESLDDAQSTVRIAAAESYHALLGSSDKLISATIVLVADDDRRVRLRAKTLLLLLAPLDQAHLDQLRTLRHDVSGAVRQSIDATLKQLSRAESSSVR